MMLLLVGLALYFLMRTLVRGRPGLAIGWPIAVAVGLRVLAAAGVSLTSIASELGAATSAPSWATQRRS